jgi:transposase InsO family protein
VLTTAIRHRQPTAELIHHSDHGCQYTSLAFQQQLSAAGLRTSIGTVGDCFDKTAAESFFTTLNCALLHCQVWLPPAVARLVIFPFGQVWHNRRRRHFTRDGATATESGVVPNSNLSTKPDQAQTRMADQPWLVCHAIH